MKKKHLAILMLIITAASSYYLWRQLNAKHEPVIDNVNYKFELDTIENLRKALLHDNADLRKIKRVFIKNITTKIFPYWYGTKWDYNGTTQMPGEGSIACGYFVTTTLKHMGVPINRVKMAQCASEEMIKSLTDKKNIHHLTNETLLEFEKKLIEYGTGLYIIGLDNHTGFILVSESGNYFIHSSGWPPYKVVKEIVGESSILAKAKYRVVGKISDDEGFLKRWVKPE